MGETRRFTIDLPVDVADIVERQVAEGRFANVSEAVADNLRDLAGHEAALKRWLREEVIPGHEAYLADPSSAIPTDQVLARIKARKARRRAS